MVGLGGLAIGLGLLFISAFQASVVLLILAVIFITLGEGLFDPSYNSRLSQSVSEDKQGQLQGANQSLQSAYRIVVPLIAAAIYVYSHSILFAIASLLAVWALAMFARLPAPASDASMSANSEKNSQVN